MSRGFILIWLLFVGGFAISQDRCGTPSQPFLEEQKFENWMLQKKFEKSLQLRVSSEEAVVYTLPVVVHIIHNGESVGIGGNLSEAKIQEQIDILNEDFRQLNPRTGTVPGIFLDRLADIEIEFALAIRDPSGFPTNGIVRKQGVNPSYSFPGTNLKQESYWPAEDYINIWVAETNSFLGWATFPQSELSGLGGAETNRLYDGVVINKDWWGINSNTGGSFDSFGQTASHEVGHFLGLRHIWGDGGCSASDYCNDTPPAAGDYGGQGSPCAFPAIEIEETPFADGNSCSSDVPDLPDMFMNFMDYTNDECMSMFTLDQKSRIRTVIENSPRRLSLLTSQGLDTPNSLSLDMAITEVSETPIIICQQELLTTLTLKNIGLTEVTSLTLTYSVDETQFIINESDLNLASGDPYELPITANNLSDGNHSFTWEITTVNGLTDDNPNDNSRSTSVEVQAGTFDAPFKENFSADTWSIVSLETSEWENISINSNPSMRAGAFDDNTGNESWLVSPVFDLSDFEEAGLFFRMSYGVRFGFSDNLELKIATSCSGDFQTIWEADLGSLAFPASEFAWTPSSAEDWLDRFIDMTDYVEFEEVRLAFVFTNNGGNNFYLDDVELTNNNNPKQPRLSDGRFVAYPNPAKQSFNVTVSLPEAQPIRVQMIDMSGAIVSDLIFENTLNETFSFETPKKYGMYFLRVIGENIHQTQRILINR